MDMYAFEIMLKMDRQLIDQHHARRATWHDGPAGQAAPGAVSVRRRLALTLLTLADWLDPRGVAIVPHAPGQPALNGALHHT